MSRVQSVLLNDDFVSNPADLHILFRALDAQADIPDGNQHAGENFSGNNQHAVFILMFLIELGAQSCKLVLEHFQLFGDQLVLT